MAPSPLIGIVDDERNIQITLAAILERRGFASVPAFTGKQGLAMIAEHHPAAVLLDLGLPDGEGLDYLRQIRTLAPSLPVIVVTAHDSLNNAIESIKMGAFHFLSKPYVPEELTNLLRKALDQHELRAETIELRAETDRLKKRIESSKVVDKPVFQNPKMVELADLTEQVAPSEANVLLVGESGVGKEVFATRVHELSLRSAGPLVRLNCAAFPQNMIEGELFGYKKGAFTGASQDFPGMLSASSGGTLFLDEIAEMPVDLQTRFLRVLQEREFRPLGSTTMVKADFRLIAATNLKPLEAIRAGKLREDLFYRLNTFTLSIPPLRERREDIPALTQLFLQRFATRLKKGDLAISPETYEIFLSYRWPGNVRELQNVVERAVVLARDGVIVPKNLPPEMLEAMAGAGNCNGGPSESSAGTAAVDLSPPPMRTAEVPINGHANGIHPANGEAVVTAGTAAASRDNLNLAEREKAALLEALERCHGNKKKAAAMLGIHRPTLYTKLKKFGLEAPAK